jgi:hypothetical protein
MFQRRGGYLQPRDAVLARQPLPIAAYQSMEAKQTRGMAASGINQQPQE